MVQQHGGKAGICNGLQRVLGGIRLCVLAEFTRPPPVDGAAVEPG